MSKRGRLPESEKQILNKASYAIEFVIGFIGIIAGGFGYFYAYLTLEFAIGVFLFGLFISLLAIFKK